MMSFLLVLVAEKMMMATQFGNVLNAVAFIVVTVMLPTKDVQLAGVQS